MTDIFIESMLCEQNQLLDKFNVEIEEAKIALLESMDPSPFFEAESEEKKSGGIFQAILRILRAVVNAIKDGFKKIGNWITGTKVTPEGQTARIQGMDPNAVVKLVNGDLADASDALRKAAAGQMTIEEAKAFIDKKESFWKTLKTSAVPVIGLAAFFTAKRFTVDPWIREVNQAADDVEKQQYMGDPKSDAKLASRVAGQDGDQAKRDTAKDAANYIVNYMQGTTRKGLDLIMTPVREAFQKGYLTRKLLNDAALMGTAEGRKKLNDRDKQKIAAVNAETNRVNILGRNVDKARRKGKLNLGNLLKAEDKLAQAKRNTFDNVK